MSPVIVRTIDELRLRVRELRAAGHTIGLVPTMGALHEGHLSLVQAAKDDGHKVIVSIFVNPTQFNDKKDLEKYPRNEAADVALLEPLDVAIVWAPHVEEMYADGFATTVSVSGITDGLCGATRPGHFDGVATVVSKLLLQALPDAAYFGQKDYQQLAVINRLVADLNIPAKIVGCPILREVDGLAMSSRNVRLSEKGRKTAALLFQTLSQAAEDIDSGKSVETVMSRSSEALLAAGFEAIDYLEMRSADDLSPMTEFDRPARLFVAAFLDGVRLIDNVVVKGR
ncbi:pantoate--beta-alanine ligase [uncultured Maritalea sp.]|jgi:pantoate--beta-alanine ligase|uniref:pantoate--beta-alanine ligase n=1 Tax=uncultured Maritalea sp. TaxID=757249 RepID=UPI00260757BE|nr:pantoate--beta-alanine ligase [uncultured Maritalea sp.]